MRISIVAFALLACFTAAYSQGKADAEKLGRVLKGDDKGSAANNPQCKLFTPAEAGGFIGEKVVKVENAAMGSACEWSAGDENGSLIVAVVPATYHEPPSRAKGFKPLPDVGRKGFVSPQLGGWVAGAIVGPQAIRVTLDGKGASEAKTVEALKATISKRAAAGSK